MKAVLIACVPQDEALAEEMGYILGQEGWAHWISSRDFPKDNSRLAVLSGALDQATALIALISNHSNDSEELAAEIQTAVQENRFLIPVRIDSVTPSITEPAVEVGPPGDPQRFAEVIARLRALEPATEDPDATGTEKPDSGILITCGEILGQLTSGCTIAEQRFQLVAAVADGRIGKVYKARDLRRGVFVGLKQFHEAFVSNLLENLHLQIASTLEAAHPAFILPRHLLWLANETFLVEEWVEGITLLQLLKSRGSLSLVEATPILSGIADGVDSAHNSGFHEIELGLRHVFVHFNERGGLPPGFNSLQQPVSEWPTFGVKFSPLNLNLHTRVQSVPLPIAFARLFYQMLGGQTPQHSYIPLPSLSEKGNHLLKGFLKKPQYSCQELVNRICDTEKLPEALRSAAFASRESELLIGLNTARFEEERNRIATLWVEREKERRRRLRRQQQEHARSLSAMTASMAEASALTAVSDEPTRIHTLKAEEAIEVDPPKRVQKRKRPFLLVASTAALLTAAGGASVYWMNSNGMLFGKSPEELFADYSSELDQLEASAEWSAIFNRLPEISEQFEGDHEARLLERARASIPALYDSLDTAPDADLVRRLDDDSRMAIHDVLAKKATQLKDSIEFAAMSQLMAYHSEIFPEEVRPEITELSDSVISRQLARFGSNPYIPEETEKALLEQIATQGHSGARSLLDQIVRFSEEEEARLAALSEKEAFEEERQQAEAWQNERNWKALFAKLPQYLEFPGDDEGILRQMAEASIAPRFADLNEAPSPGEIAALDPEAQTLVRDQFGLLASQSKNELATLARLFRYHESLFPNEVHADLSKIGHEVVARLAEQDAPLNDPQVQILKTLESWDSPEAAAILAKNAELLEHLAASQERWTNLEAKFQQAESNNEHLSILQEVDSHTEFLNDEEKGSILRQFAQLAATSLMKTPEALPSAGALANFGTLARNELLAAAESEALAAVQGEVNLLDFLRFAAIARSLSDSDLSESLLSAGNGLVASLSQSSSMDEESETALAQLEDLGIGAAGEALETLREARGIQERFEESLAEARALAGQQSWRALFDRIDSYQEFPESQRDQLMAIASPSVTRVYASLGQAPSAANAKTFSASLKALIRPLLAGYASQAAQSRDINTFLAYFNYDRQAFGGQLPAEMLRAGNTATAVLRDSLPQSRPQLVTLRDAGVPEAQNLLRQLEEQEKEREMAERKAAAIAQAEQLGSRNQIPEALRAYLGLRSHYATPAEWAQTHSRAINSLLEKVSSAAAVKAELTELGKLGFAGAQTLLKSLEPPKLTGLAALREAWRKDQKNTKLLLEYMSAAKLEKSYAELESLCFHALNLGQIDAAFSTLNGLYMNDSHPISKTAAAQIPKELAKRSAARKGWHGIWLVNGIPPFSKSKTNHDTGMQLLKEAARAGHVVSQDMCRRINLPY